MEGLNMNLVEAISGVESEQCSYVVRHLAMGDIDAANNLMAAIALIEASGFSDEKHPEYREVTDIKWTETTASGTVRYRDEEELVEIDLPEFTFTVEHDLEYPPLQYDEE